MATLTPQTTDNVWVITGNNSGGSQDQVQLVQTNADAGLVTDASLAEVLRTAFVNAGLTQVSVYHYAVSSTLVPAP